MGNPPTVVYYGKLEAMIAEVAAFDCRQIVPTKDCRYLVLPYAAVQYDTEFFKTRKEAAEYARYVAAQYGSCKVAFVV